MSSNIRSPASLLFAFLISTQLILISANLPERFQCFSQCRSFSTAVRFCERNSFRRKNCSLQKCAYTRKNGSTAEGFQCVDNTNDQVNVALSVSSTPSPSATPSASVTPSPSATPSVSMTPSPSITPTPTVSPTPSITPSPSVTPSASVTPTPSVSATPSASPSASVTPTPSTTPSPSPSPSPTPTDNLLWHADYNTTTCPAGKVVKTTEVGQADCNLFDRRYEVFVGFTTVTPKTTLCFQNRFSAGGNTAGCRVCGTGTNFARTLHIVIDARRSADVRAGNSRCDALDINRAMSEAIYEWASVDQLCTGRDFTVDDGGDFINVDLVNAMPGIMQNALCKDA